MDKIDDLFVVSSDSASGLRWKVSRYSGRDYNILSANVGDIAGTVGKRGYWVVEVNRKKTPVHRIIWEILYGPIPNGMVIDHINGIKSDNAINNLRCITVVNNNRNRGVSNKSKSGVNGVSYKEISGRNGNIFRYWSARIKDNYGKVHSKVFSIEKLGNHKALEYAIKFRFEILEIFESELKERTYSERHTRRIE